MQVDNGREREFFLYITNVKSPFHFVQNYKAIIYNLTSFTCTGHYVPQLAREIVTYNQGNSHSIINLKGFIVS